MKQDARRRQPGRKLVTRQLEHTSKMARDQSETEVVAMRMCLRAGFGLCAAAGLMMNAAPARGANPPAYAITAANVTMPISGNGLTQYTVRGIPSTGTLAVSCQYSGQPTTARIPICTYGPRGLMQVTAGQSVTGTIQFFPFGSAIPASAQRRNRPGGALALAGMLLVGLGLRRGLSGILRTLVLAIALAGVVGVTGCGANPDAMTPGTYSYTITADNEASPNTPLGQGVSTTIQVTVP